MENPERRGGGEVYRRGIEDERSRFFLADFPLMSIEFILVDEGGIDGGREEDFAPRVDVLRVEGVLLRRMRAGGGQRGRRRRPEELLDRPRYQRQPTSHTPPASSATAPAAAAPRHRTRRRRRGHQKHVERSQGSVGLWYKFVRIGNLVRVHPRSKEQYQRGYRDQEEGNIEIMNELIGGDSNKGLVSEEKTRGDDGDQESFVLDALALEPLGVLLEPLLEDEQVLERVPGGWRGTEPLLLLLLLLLLVVVVGHLGKVLTVSVRSRLSCISYLVRSPMTILLEASFQGRFF